MPIAKGQPWGGPGPLPADGVVVGQRRRGPGRGRARPAGPGGPFPVLGLLGGDLCRTLGGARRPGPAAVARGRSPFRSTSARSWPTAGSTGSWPTWSPDHRLWRRAFVAMNAQWYGAWNLGPGPTRATACSTPTTPSSGLGDLWQGAQPAPPRRPPAPPGHPGAADGGPPGGPRAAPAPRARRRRRGPGGVPVAPGRARRPPVVVVSGRSRAVPHPGAGGAP